MGTPQTADAAESLAREHRLIVARSSIIAQWYEGYAKALRRQEANGAAAPNFSRIRIHELDMRRTIIEFYQDPDIELGWREEERLVRSFVMHVLRDKLAKFSLELQFITIGFGSTGESIIGFNESRVPTIQNS